MAKPQRLVIVESPTKATKIASFLGEGYVVESSRGHVRDLPTGAAEVPARFKGEKWARIGVDVDNGFEPLYVVASDKKSVIRSLKALLADADELLLATDEDREGEAIAWHLLQELKPRVPVKRMVFHEITRGAIMDAVAHPRDLDTDLVDAQETRRILDRLYGYEVSPVLWKKVMPKLSAGRVQSVATRLIVDRERERRAFVKADYAAIEAVLDAGAAAEPRLFSARLTTIGDVKVAQGRDFNARGQLVTDKVFLLGTASANNLVTGLRGASFTVTSVEAKPYVRRPYAPFRTTTLQQEAGRKLGFTAQRTMSVAQKLYEGGYITYMRTDSVTLSAAAIQAARQQVRQLYGDAYVPEKPRIYTSKVKNAQEAHEAIRPAGDSFQTPAQTGLAGEDLRLYELILKRTIASQMSDCIGEAVTVGIAAVLPEPVEVVRPDSGAMLGVSRTGFTATGRTITFPGFLKAYVESVDEGTADDDQKQLPQLVVGAPLAASEITASSHETRPPARYTEPSLVAKLEELEIGRPSTYASIIRTITSRDYVFKKGSALVPTWLAFAVTRLLEEHFSTLVDYDFTAGMEETLDAVAAGKAKRVEVLSDFYFGPKGATHQGLHSLVNELGEIDARKLSTFAIGDGIDVRVGRYGTYLEDSEGRRANVDPNLPPDELTVDYAKELLAKPAAVDRELGRAATGYLVVAKDGRFGPYVTEVLPDDAPRAAKARTASLFKHMSIDTVTLAEAEMLLSLPRLVGKDAQGVEITAQNGRFGAYLKRGTESRSLAREEDILTITLPEAEAIFAQPKQPRRTSTAANLRELGPDPESRKPIVIKSGRYGPYITDGEINVTVPRSEDPDTIMPEQASALLAEKRAKGPAPRRSGRTSTGSATKPAGTRTATRTRAAKSAEK